MKLETVHIRNFRSIKDCTVSFDQKCRVLVGINESGKSNILRALSLLGDEHDPMVRVDLREALKNEVPISKACVDFAFALEKRDTDALIAEVREKVLCKPANPSMVSVGKAKKSLSTVCRAYTKVLYQVDVLEEKKSFRYYGLGPSYRLLSGWKKPTRSCPTNFQVEIGDVQYVLSNYELVRDSDLTDMPEEYVEDAEVGDLERLLGLATTELAGDSVPKVLFWEYDEANLLPEHVEIATFLSDPGSCEPLKKMFELAGYEDIGNEIERARKGTDNQFQNFLDRIADRTTRHFRSVWPEYNTIRFSLRANAERIVPGVKEKNVLDFARRSDGFKRFVTFLLMVSVDAKMRSLANALVLIDEPDFSLHPSGSRFLRDELIKIARTNYVMYSTHSIFMIDAGNIERHYIVKKTGEVTKIDSAKESNVADEEVLFNALGHSIFAILKAKNVIFEGWRDKRLFAVALDAASAATKRKFENTGLCHAKGVGSIKTISSMVELGGRECLIVSDADSPAMQEKKLYEQRKGYGQWKTYQDLDSSITAITAEDFLENELIARMVNRCIAGKGLPEFDVSELHTSGKLLAIGNWLTKKGIPKVEAKDAVASLKDSLFAGLGSSDVTKEYTLVLKGIGVVQRGPRT